MHKVRVAKKRKHFSFTRLANTRKKKVVSKHSHMLLTGIEVWWENNWDHLLERQIFSNTGKIHLFFKLAVQ